MTNTTTQPANPPEPDDLDAWLRSLSKRPAPGKPAPLTEESAMRQAILNYHQREEEALLNAANLANDDHAWQRMRFRLKSEGLAGKRPAWQIWMPAAAAAVVLAAVMVPNLMQGPGNDSVVVSYAEPPVLRGPVPETAVPDPLKAAQQLATQLRAFDPAVRLFWFGNVATIDFEAKPEQLDAMAPLLKGAFPSVKLRTGWNQLVFTQKK